MTAGRPQTQRARDDKADTRLSVLEYKVDELKQGLDRVEYGQSQMSKQLDTLRYVSLHEFEEYKKEVAKTYETKASQKFIKTIGYSLATGLMLSFIGFMVWVLQRAVDK